MFGFPPSKEELIAYAVATATLITLADIIAHKTREFLSHNWQPFKAGVREARLFWRELRTPLPTIKTRERRSLSATEKPAPVKPMVVSAHDRTAPPRTG